MEAQGAIHFKEDVLLCQTKPMQDCHSERSEESLAGQRFFAPLRMTKRDGLLFEMYWAQGAKPSHGV
jgi:hypothetical protein